MSTQNDIGLVLLGAPGTSIAGYVTPSCWWGGGISLLQWKHLETSWKLLETSWKGNPKGGWACSCLTLVSTSGSSEVYMDIQAGDFKFWKSYIWPENVARCTIFWPANVLYLTWRSVSMYYISNLHPILYVFNLVENGCTCCSCCCCSSCDLMVYRDALWAAKIPNLCPYSVNSLLSNAITELANFIHRL